MNNLGQYESLKASEKIYSDFVYLGTFIKNIHIHLYWKKTDNKNKTRMLSVFCIARNSCIYKIYSNESFDYHKSNSRKHLLKNWSPSARVYTRICKFHLFHNFTGKIQLFALSGALLESKPQATFYIINNYSGMLWIFQLLISPALYHFSM